MTDEEPNAIFRNEAETLVETLEERLLRLEATPGDADLIDAVFRDLHTLKGSGAMFGRHDVANFLHGFETAFEAVREGRAKVSEQLIAISLAAKDHIATLLSKPGADGGDAILNQLSVYLERTPETPQDSRLWHLTFKLAPDTLALGGRPEAIIDDLRSLGFRDIRALLGDVPPLSKIDPERLYISWEAWIDRDIGRDEILTAFLFHEDGLELTLAPPIEEATARDLEDPKPDSTRSPANGRGGALMRVPAERLDEMMDRVGELVIAEARLREAAARIGESGLSSIVEDISRLTSGMRETTMSVRMTPISAITGRFRRLAHDLAGKLGRHFDFVTEGEKTELDKTVVERLAEPLMHIIRNAADHGLEDPSLRSVAGKPAIGTIRLEARYAGAEVLISLSDDGRGLDREAIRKRAVERGLIASNATLSDEEIFGLIFEPGFSTAAEVTDLSGRGVGMDVVRRTIDELRGTVEVSSEPGYGTSVSLRLPLTLAIIDGLLVDLAGERFVLPLAAVLEIVELPAEHGHPTSRNAFLDIRDTLVPFLRLRDLLESPGEPAPFQKVIVVSSADGRVGLVVDRIIGSNQTVIKQLSPLHSGLKLFSGATILGDGGVALILDIPQLVHRGRCLAERAQEAA
ncbi:chemotaxis protein CheA [Roseivivax sp. THAF30]|uniref:chemotaxis protein CheA n=1 Tax=Roseivivax sp. THAF30 TaxID=2587852 RepID=UPI0012685B5C|nr:chemotaxis protein CheA [Roseivivax sp. THAF30]QFT64564.1 Chemotaxis protein CheA [Roseivivax sp. THAF30]